MHKNLSFTFPNKKESEIIDLQNHFFKHFFDIILESLKGLSYPPRKLVERYTLINPELLDAYYNNGQSLIVLSQHFNNWEWGPICIGLQIKHHVVGIIKPLGNKWIHNYMLKGRMRSNVSVVPTYQAKDYLTNHGPAQPELLVFFMDQYPIHQSKSFAVDFFNRQVRFHNGVEKYANMLNYPILASDVKRIGRGQYTVELIPICNKPAAQPSGTVTQLYANFLEKIIEAAPASWLWSHKRYKDDINY